MTRRRFMGFFLIGGFISLLTKKLSVIKKPQKALFWKKVS
jgi:hypothetical protein